MSWFRQKRRPPRLTDAAKIAAIEVDVDPERDGWAVLGLYGYFLAPSAVALLSRVLLDVLLDGYPLVVADVRRARRLSPEAYQTLVSGADLFRSCGGVLVVSGIGARDAEAIRLLDLRHEIDLLHVTPR